MFWLRLSLVVAFLFSLSFFIFIFFKIYQYYRPRAQARPRGEIKKGKIYALTIGLLPWEKESTQEALACIYHRDNLSFSHCCGFSQVAGYSPQLAIIVRSTNVFLPAYRDKLWSWPFFPAAAWTGTTPAQPSGRLSGQSPGRPLSPYRRCEHFTARSHNLFFSERAYSDSLSSPG